MYKFMVSALVLISIIPKAVFASDLGEAVIRTKEACSGISDSMHDMKVKAGINTAVTAVGTVSAGVALGTGIAKQKKDDEFNELSQELVTLAATKAIQDKLDIMDKQVLINAVTEYVKANPKDERIDDMVKLDKESKKLGNIRTGTLAVTTATNIAGTAIAATNKVDSSLEENINKCITAVQDLSKIKMTAVLEGSAETSEVNDADKIVAACSDYELVDLSPINNRAVGAAVASGLGAGAGLAGLITSAMANTEKTRSQGGPNEEKLNTTANVMAGTSAVAGATATVFNATQIAAIKKVVAAADKCEEALQ